VEGGFEETRLHLSPPRLRSGRVPPRPVPPGAGGEWGGGPCADPLTRWGPCLRTPFLVATCVTPAPRGPRPCTRAPTPTPTTPSRFAWHGSVPPLHGSCTPLLGGAARSSTSAGSGRVAPRCEGLGVGPASAWRRWLCVPSSSRPSPPEGFTPPGGTATRGHPCACV
jgi:hypothetical protein